MADPLVYADEALLQELASTEDAWAEGASLYGAGGLLDSQRKIILSVALLEIRDSLPEKVTEKVLDAMGHTASEYKAFVNAHVVGRAQWLALDAKRTRIYMEIKSIQARGYDARRNGA
jgi:hypothetical protein